MVRPKDAEKKEKLGYDTLSITIPPWMREALEKLPKGKKGEFIREAIDEKLQRMGIPVQS